MEAFVWDERFVTGIPSVDAQHRHLVDIVNRVGDLLLAEGEGTDEALQQIFKQNRDRRELDAFVDEFKARFRALSRRTLAGVVKRR